MYRFFATLDRRWVFLLMLLAVAVPILIGLRFPEEPSPMAQRVGKTIEDLPPGSVVLMALDYDPSAQGELQPMASAFTRHAAENGHRLIFMTLWPQGGPMVGRSVRLIENEYPDYQYGRDYVNLGYRPGNEGVIKVIVNDLRKLFANDVLGNDLDELPLTRNLQSVREVDLIINVSAGDPGAKQWVQFAATPFDIPMVAGTTGPQAPDLLPDIANQLIGMLGAIKGAAEYEQVLLNYHERLRANDNTQIALRRMGAQTVAHVLMVLLIVAGNVIFFIGRARGVAR
jgi:hypothetical protein